MIRGGLLQLGLHVFVPGAAFAQGGEHIAAQGRPHQIGFQLAAQGAGDGRYIGGAVPGAGSCRQCRRRWPPRRE